MSETTVTHHTVEIKSASPPLAKQEAASRKTNLQSMAMPTTHFSTQRFIARAAKHAREIAGKRPGPDNQRMPTSARACQTRQRLETCYMGSSFRPRNER